MTLDETIDGYTLTVNGFSYAVTLGLNEAGDRMPLFVCQYPPRLTQAQHDQLNEMLNKLEGNYE